VKNAFTTHLAGPERSLSVPVKLPVKYKPEQSSQGDLEKTVDERMSEGAPASRHPPLASSERLDCSVSVTVAIER
jgi:hypothetical protein